MAKGGKRPGAGRPRGTQNKATREIRTLASKYGPEAIKGIHHLAVNAENEATRLAAWDKLLDRGYGKPTQPVSGDDSAPPVQIIERVIVDPQNQNG